MRHQRKVPVDLPVSFLRFGASPGRPVLLMLHGFRETADDFVARAFEAPAENLPFEIFAPNAPFPMPARREGKYVEAYSWYFRDIDRQAVMIPPEVGAQALFALMKDLDLVHRNVIIAGFSQGGFFAPHIARLLPRVLGIIAVASGFRPDEYDGISPCPVSAIHGSSDKIISVDLMLKGLQPLRDSGFTAGSVKIIDGLGHEMNPAARLALRGLVADLT